MVEGYYTNLEAIKFGPEIVILSTKRSSARATTLSGVKRFSGHRQPRKPIRLANRSVFQVRPISKAVGH